MRTFSTFGYAFFLRVLVPGFVAALFLSPIIVTTSVRLEIIKTIKEMGYSPNPSLIFLILAVSTGIFLTFIEDKVYKLFEGRIGWPKFIRECLTKRLNVKIRKKRITYNETEDKNIQSILRQWLMQFPIKSKATDYKEREATLPTVLGNILVSYENYPHSRYKMSASFYWPRLWLSLDNDTRKEVSTTWAEADSTTYISFIFLCLFIIYILAFILDLGNVPTLFWALIDKGSFNFTHERLKIIHCFYFFLSIISLILFWFFYRISLPLHYRNGKIFQSLFDLHRDKISKMTQIIQADDPYSWHATWIYLNHDRKKCSECGNNFQVHMERCPSCGFVNKK